MQRDTVWLLDIVQRARLIREFVEGYDQHTFASDILRREAVIRQIEVIGEAVRRLSEEFKAGHPDIPWHEITAMRNRMIHEYDRVDLIAVWQAAQHDIPALIATIAPLVPPDEDAADNTSR